ncbi:unnamed protein product [Rhodiola kirilowii]
MYFLLLVFGNIVLVEEHDDDVHFKIRSAARSSLVVETYADQKKDHWDDHMISPAYHPAAKAVDINYMSKRRVPNGADPIHNSDSGELGSIDSRPARLRLS